MARTFFIVAFLVLALAGLIATAANYHWWRTPIATPLPPAASEYGKLLARYGGVDALLDVAGTIRIYDGETLKETRTFRCFRDRERYYWQLSYLRTFCDGRYVLQVDSVHRMMVVSKAAVVGAATRMPMDVLFSDTATFRMTGTVVADGAQRVLTVQNDYQPAVRQCRLFYDTADYRLRRTEIEWWKEGRPADTTRAVWLGKVEYDQARRQTPDIDAEMAAFISIGQAGVKTRPGYEDYQVNINF